MQRKLLYLFTRCLFDIIVVSDDLNIKESYHKKCHQPKYDGRQDRGSTFCDRERKWHRLLTYMLYISWSSHRFCNATILHFFEGRESCIVNFKVFLLVSEGRNLILYGADGIIVP